jgi:hypothetical protein
MTPRPIATNGGEEHQAEPAERQEQDEGDPDGEDGQTEVFRHSGRDPGHDPVAARPVEAARW